MTGEMHESEVTREEYPLHFAIADALNGDVRPFDQYQGPYVYARGARLWICSEDSAILTVYNEGTDKESSPFFADEKCAVSAALETIPLLDWPATIPVLAG